MWVATQQLAPARVKCQRGALQLKLACFHLQCMQCHRSEVRVGMKSAGHGLGHAHVHIPQWHTLTTHIGGARHNHNHSIRGWLVGLVGSAVGFLGWLGRSGQVGPAWWSHNSFLPSPAHGSALEALLPPPKRGIPFGSRAWFGGFQQRPPNGSFSLSPDFPRKSRPGFVLPGPP